MWVHNPLSTVVFAWLLEVWGAVSRAGIVLGRLEPHSLKSGPTAPGAYSFVASFPSRLWVSYFTETHPQGELVSVDGLTGYQLPGSILS